MSAMNYNQTVSLAKWLTWLTWMKPRDNTERWVGLAVLDVPIGIYIVLLISERFPAWQCGLVGIAILLVCFAAQVIWYRRRTKTKWSASEVLQAEKSPVSLGGSRRDAAIAEAGQRPEG
ncbi:hypothetical protein [Candidatus Poriferisodalis sp.]|uniref:hypothetical protein n=1 Tax=Candidatus Poriferisodalis sp. TaxID=3101277 RepID=UPI003B015F8B